MRATRWVILIWSGMIAVLLLVEVAELTHLFTLPIQSAIGDPLAFIIALVFTTILALVGAMFIGIYVSARILRSQGFTPFEEEMLKMRAEVRDIKAAIERSPPSRGGPRPDAPTDPPEESPP